MRENGETQEEHDEHRGKNETGNQTFINNNISVFILTSSVL